MTREGDGDPDRDPQVEAGMHRGSWASGRPLLTSYPRSSSNSAKVALQAAAGRFQSWHRWQGCSGAG